MSLISRKEMAADLAEVHERMFKCPHCGSSMKVTDRKSLVCTRRHTFDFARQGYVHLAGTSVKTQYGKELFEARRKLLAETGWFRRLDETVAAFVAEQTPERDGLRILDAGCGEGTHLAEICGQLVRRGRNATGFGVDLAKEGIMTAARSYREQIWVVGDLARTPFADGSFDVILNILSPSNYGEFRRLLKPGGLLVKVVPGPDYLLELRKSFFDDPGKQAYSNEAVVDRFRERFRMLDRMRLRHAVPLNREDAEALVLMTPLGWNVPEEKVRAFLERRPREITLDLEIIAGQTAEG
ncbi:methyltransferase domain-containing protein [Staphylospora marina]|uniref:methyltransferase domain-containing protein n=1 Tax=Staphylospora marina TaxID=2490858 RepID=UPI001F155039|nr:methyltransferase domain-containing protein [Staphylospora marina]